MYNPACSAIWLTSQLFFATGFSSHFWCRPSSCLCPQGSPTLCTSKLLLHNIYISIKTEAYKLKPINRLLLSSFFLSFFSFFSFFFVKDWRWQKTTVTSIRAHQVPMDHLTTCENCLANREISFCVSIIPGRRLHWSQLTIFCFCVSVTSPTFSQHVTQTNVFDQH